MTKKRFEPNLRTPLDQLSDEETNKRREPWLLGTLPASLRDGTPDLAWEAEQLAKSYGIYLEFDRAKTGEAKDWMYMIRVANPGGGPISRAQWQLLDELSERHTRDRDGVASLRLTTRQALQFHWVRKPAVLEIVRALAEAGLRTLNACGDNTRNALGCPLGRFSDVHDPHALARRAGEHFQLPLEPFLRIFEIDPTLVRKPETSFSYGPGLLNRKFKMAFSAVHRDPDSGRLVADNCVELRTNDLGVAPLVNAAGDTVEAYVIYAGGGQGERQNRPTTAALGVPFARVTEDELLDVMNAIVEVHQEWGDRQNRHWARLKYVIRAQGVDWLRERVGEVLGRRLVPPPVDHDPGPRELHHGWTRQPSNGLWSFGAFIENGRLVDSSPNGRLKTMVRRVVEDFPVALMVTPNQDLVFTDVPGDAREEFEAALRVHGFGTREGKPYSTLRRLSGACVGLDTCRLSYTESERFEPELMDALERLGWGDLAESVGVTGCERQCFRPATKTIGLVGSGSDQYLLKVFGDRTARFQGRPLISADGERLFLRAIPRARVATVLDALFRRYVAQRASPDESLGEYLRRIGPEALIAYFAADPASADLMAKSYRTDNVLE